MPHWVARALVAALLLVGVAYPAPVAAALPSESLPPTSDTAASETPSESPSPDPTATATPTPDPTAEPTPTPEPTPEPTATPEPAPTPTPTPAPECRATPDSRSSVKAKGRPFVVCDVEVISKKHRVTAAFKPSLVRVGLPAHGLSAVYLQGKAGKELKALFAAARTAGHRLVVRSAYRSYATQKRIYRPGAKLTAPPGASEHQSGLAVDLAAKSGRVVRGYAFGRSKAGAWVRKHAAEYGFILRYPKGKQKITGIPYEPWHFRYVGEEVAKGVSRTPTKTLERYLRVP